MNLFRGTLARRGPPAGVRRPGGRPGAGGRRPHGRPRPSSTRSTPTSCGRATRPIPILYEVDRIRDGRSFTTRRVVAIQHGQAIFNLQASFHTDEDGLDHQVPMPDVPDPESLPDFRTRMAPYKRPARRVVRPAPPDRPALRRTRRRSSAPSAGADRASRCGCGPTASCPTTRCCTPASLTYASDMTLLDTTLLPHGVSLDRRPVQMASLDHAMWFHRPFRADEWLLYDQDTPSTSQARGLGTGLDLHPGRPDGGLGGAGGPHPGRAVTRAARRRALLAPSSASSWSAACGIATPTTPRPAPAPPRSPVRRSSATSSGPRRRRPRHRAARARRPRCRSAPTTAATAPAALDRRTSRARPGRRARATGGHRRSGRAIRRSTSPSGRRSRPGPRATAGVDPDPVLDISALDHGPRASRGCSGLAFSPRRRLRST